MTDEANSLVKYQEFEAAIPKFRQECQTDIRRILQSFGIIDLFNSEIAVFSESCELKNSAVKMHVSDFYQKALIDINETGIKACAVSFMCATYGCDEDNCEVETRIYLDRPFLYMIFDQYAGVPVILGKVKYLNQNRRTSPVE